MKPLNLILAVIVACLSAPSILAQKVVRVSEPDAVDPAEVTIAINPNNPDNVVAASFARGRAPHLNGSYNYASMDGGKTWKTIPVANPRNLWQGDDVVYFGSDGTAYHIHLSFIGIRVAHPRRAETGMLVESSANGGLTWTDSVAAINHENSVTPFEDKPGIVVDNAPQSKYKGNIYLAWTRFDAYGSSDPDCHSHIYFTRSTDHGKSFAMPVGISDSVGDCRDSDNTVEGAVPAVAPNGDIYIVWAGPAGLVFKKSTDGGETFTKEKVISEMPGGWDFSVDGLERANGMPLTAVDLSDGPNKGTLYVNWIDARNGDADVFVMSSKDGGGTWSAPVRVNDDPVKNGKVQFFTWMSVDPVDGSVNIVFYDRRDTTGSMTKVVMARSIDGGKTFVNHKVAQPAFRCDGNTFFGDYTGISAFGGRVIPMFMNFDEQKKLVVSVALFRFKLGSQELVP